MNIKFQKYKDVFSQPERIRLKRKTNENEENIIVRNATNNLNSLIRLIFMGGESSYITL